MVVLGISLALALVSAEAARSSLAVGKAAMERGRSALISGDDAAASAAFAAAGDAFAQASGHASNPVLRASGLVPLLGRTPNAVASLSRAGELVAEAGQGVAGSLAKLPGGIEALAPKQGSIPIDVLAKLVPAVDRSALLAHQALEKVMRTKGFLLIGPLTDFPSDQIQPPNPSFARSYDQFGGAGFWRNINMTPDFPSAAVAIERLYRKATGTALDGVIAADPFALADLLKVTGPVVARPGEPALDASNVVRYVANEAYNRFHDATARKLIIGEVAKSVFNRFMRGAGSASAAATTLAGTLAGGHLVLHTIDPRLEQGLERAGLAGALRPAGGSVLAIVQNNGAANKVDFYETRSVRYAVRLESGGRARAEATVRLANGAPTSGQDPEVIGPFPGFRVGENAAILSLYCGPPCSLDGVVRDSKPERVGFGQELGVPFLIDEVRIPAGSSTELVYSTHDPRAWDGDATGGVYRLTFVNQTTIRPTSLRLEVRPPSGMFVVGASPGMRIESGTAVWEGIPGRVQVFEVEFRRPLWQRMWRKLVHFISKPIVKL